ncbi:hypothetical protein C2S51_022050 [Perilla frutescens var. frutescens]|nr:hypothetical protein C2S51_022050 [Perilla frutescens var. frutescens]
MAEAVVSIALETVRDLLLEEGRFLLGVGDEVKALQTQLKEMKCLLQDADRRQHESKIVRNCITQIRNLTYRAEDVILQNAVRMSSDGAGREREHGLKRLIARFSRALSLSCCSLHQLGSEVLNIKTELARITETMQTYGIRRIIEGGETSASTWARKSFPSFEIGDCFVGKEEDLKQLVSLVADDEQQLHRVVSVWGMGGIGKTTIAKKVYNQMKEAKNLFDSFAWVCISQQCQTRSVLEDVLKQLKGVQGVPSSLSDTQLIEELCEVQRAKRCFVVVDDLWQISHWDGLKHAFLVRDLKSKILVTTRNQKVAEIGFAVTLGLLNLDDAWELLKMKAFPHGNIPAGEGDDEKENQIHGVLNMSYEDLPYYLKPCFLYLGILKEDETIHAKDLYKRWIAQGMVSNENIRGEEETLIDVAEFYLSELASRSMIQVEVNDAMPSPKYRTCKLHDVVRELCLSMGKNEEFGVEVFEYRDGKFGSLLPEASRCPTTRHLAIHFQGEVQLEGGGDLTIMTNFKECLRSVQIVKAFGKTQFPPQCMISFEKFKMLREIAIEGFTFEGRKLPRGITNLVHLRFLALRRCELDKLPSSITNLAYLDTLDLYGSVNLRVPNVFSDKTFRLKHLILPQYAIETIGDYRLRLDQGGLDELESLEWFDSRVHELKSCTRMKNLRRFMGDIHDNESFVAIANAIAANWNKLQFCLVSIQEGCQLTSGEGLRMLKELFTTHNNLYHLRICVRVGKLLEESMSDILISSKLVILFLHKCEIEDDPMGILGKLPCLSELNFCIRSYVGEKMTCPASSFSHLKKLDFEGLPKLREWRVEQGSMPLLSQLKISNCPNLVGWRVEQGAMPVLYRLIISVCPNLREWRVEQGAMPLLSKLQISTCHGLNKVPDGVTSISPHDKHNIISFNRQTLHLYANKPPPSC